MKILFVADVVGKGGARLAARLVSKIRDERDVDFCIANGENLKQGRGLDKRLVRLLFDNGVDVITGGNHVWDSQSDKELLEDHHVLRPQNYPPGLAGRGWGVYEAGGGTKVAVLNLQGRTFLYSIDCPFRAADDLLARPEVADADVRIVDFHAEATAEKQALTWYLNGRVSAVIGTHTHVQTADARVTPEGTAAITDVGMTGSLAGVIGLDRDRAIKRFLQQTPVPFRLAKGDYVFNAVLLSVDETTGKATGIERIWLTDPELEAEK
ncbi:MAG TPA: TIGR00282 family metallophosphoesterase [Bacteroidetes bacterium]|nr:TIGR00282 family metallophosphoesterase [Bacteroidota bacterium]